MSDPTITVAAEIDAVNAADEWTTAAAEQINGARQSYLEHRAAEATIAQAQATLALTHEVRALRLAFADPLESIGDMLARIADALDRLA